MMKSTKAVPSLDMTKIAPSLEKMKERPSLEKTWVMRVRRRPRLREIIEDGGTERASADQGHIEIDMRNRFEIKVCVFCA
jgi:hypothetical protein